MISIHIPSLVKSIYIYWSYRPATKIRTCRGQITLSKNRRNLKPDIYNINARTKFGKNLFIFTPFIIRKRKYGRTDGRTTDGRTHGHLTGNRFTLPLSFWRATKRQYILYSAFLIMYHFLRFHSWNIFEPWNGSGLDFHVKTGTRFSLRDKRFFEISEVEITRVNCTWNFLGQSVNEIRNDCLPGQCHLERRDQHLEQPYGHINCFNPIS